jgi:hypothetical protein
MHSKTVQTRATSGIEPGLGDLGSEIFGGGYLVFWSGAPPRIGQKWGQKITFPEDDFDRNMGNLGPIFQFEDDRIFYGKKSIHPANRIHSDSWNCRDKYFFS